MKDNNSLKKLLLKQYKLYPKMQLQDMVKFIYQNEFAGGHMIDSEEDSLKLLKDELKILRGQDEGKSVSQPFESIGNGLYRLHLVGLKDKAIELRTINKFFVNAANSVVGTREGFEEKLNLLKALCRDRHLPYPLVELKSYILKYREEGYQPVSHSQVYRDLYRPAYRIIKEEYYRFFDLFDAIDSLMKEESPVLVAIDGNSGAGKSTLANILGQVYDCNIFHMDDFFLRPELRTEKRLREVGGNVDYIRFYDQVIKGLQGGKEFKYQPYNCQTMSLEAPINVQPKKLNIIEGVYSMHPTLIQNYHLRVFLGINPEEQSRRILERNGQVMHKRFINEWIPMEDKYFEAMDIRSKSHLVFPV
ncbi:MAG: hypothetical protein GX375_06815 [Clostridiales bacterium]|nr:hypothetical protein [Clostridiales bacterium]